MASALSLLAKPYHLPARIMQNLGSFNTTATFVLAAKSVWEACPPGSRPRMAHELEAFVKKVTDKFGSSDLEEKQRTTLAALNEDISQSTQRGFSNWMEAARRLR